MARRKKGEEPPAPDGEGEGARPQEPADEENTAQTVAPPMDEDTAQTIAPPADAADTAEIAVPEAAVSMDTEPIPFGLTSPPGHEEGEEGEVGDEEAIEPARLENIIESLLYAADRPLSANDLKRLLGERDVKRITAAVEALQARRAGSGVVVISAAGGWQLRTSPENALWVGKLLSGKPVRLSRAMMETVSIVAYRQPVTRPEIDDIRGVDCGPVLKTLLDRGLIRIIGKKEEVGRPLLYGTTPEFLRTFNLKDLSELPTLREFHELGRDEQERVDAEAPAQVADATAKAFAPHPPLPDEEEHDGLLDDLDRAAQAAARAAGAAAAAEPTQPAAADAGGDGPERAP
jgi:segregation and condensation protein B